MASLLLQKTAFVSGRPILRSASSVRTMVAARQVITCGVKSGIVGLPNVGKSTLFNALTESQAAQAANFPVRHTF